MGASTSRHVTKIGATWIRRNTADHGRYSRFTKDMELENDKEADPTVMVRNRNKF